MIDVFETWAFLKKIKFFLLFFEKLEFQNFVFENVGEDTYYLTATLEKDSTVLFKEVYIEGGYKTTETIKAKEIKTTYD